MSKSGNLRILEYLVTDLNLPLDIPQKSTLITPLCIAAYQGHLECVEFLVENEANLNQRTKQHMTPIYLAARQQNYKIIKYLCIFKDVVEGLINEPENNAFQYGIKHNDEELIKILLDFNVPANLKNSEGEEPINIATRANYLHLVEILCHYLTEVDIVSIKDQQTPFVFAVLSGFTDIADILFQMGANPRFIDSHANNLYQIAKITDNMGALNYLKERAIYDEKEMYNDINKSTDPFRLISNSSNIIDYGIPAMKVFKPAQKNVRLEIRKGNLDKLNNLGKLDHQLAHSKREYSSSSNETFSI